jgi:hypothetical protein
MQLKKFKSAIISAIVSLSLAAGLFVPSVPVLAEGETNEATASAVTNGLVAYWSFDENYQESVSGLLTTNLGANKLTYTEGIYGKAAVFNGEDNYLYVDANPILNLGNSYTDNNDNFTISAWVNLGDSKGGKKFLLDKGLNWGLKNNDKFNWTNPYRIFFDSSKPYVDLSNIFNDYGSKPQYATKGSSRTNGKCIDGEEWYLLTVTYDGKIVKVYRDNQLLMQSNYTDGITFNNDQLFIGVDYELKNYFKGAVDDLRLYTVTLSYDDVDALYQQGLAANKELVEPTKQLVAYYPFDGSFKDESIFKNKAEKIEVSGTTKFVIGKNGKGEKK